MLQHALEQQLKTYSLTFDDHLLSFTRKGFEISFQAGDLIEVEPTEEISFGKLILLELNGQYLLRRFEKNLGGSFFPPLPISGDCKVVGLAVNRIRNSSRFPIS